MEKQRGSERQVCAEVVEFTVAVLKGNRIGFIDLTGWAINRSEEGLCFVTRYPLRSGSVLKFRKSLGVYGEGIVVWIRDLGSHYVAGTRLLVLQGSPS